MSDTMTATMDLIAKIKGAIHLIDGPLLRSLIMQALDELEHSVGWQAQCAANERMIRRLTAEQADHTWRTSDPPRGKHCLVTAPNALGSLRVMLAFVSPDHDGVQWFTAVDCKPLRGVVAWMLAPDPAQGE